MDSRMDSSDHVTSIHSEEGNLYPQNISFFTIILQIFRLLLVIFGIPIRDEDDTVCTSEFMLHKDEDLTGRISDTTEHEDPADEIKLGFENGVQGLEVEDLRQSNYISPAQEDPADEIKLGFENGAQGLEVEGLSQSNYISPAEEDPAEEMNLDFGNGVQELEVKDLIQSNFITPVENDPAEEIKLDFENGVQRLEVKDLIQSNFIFPAEEEPPNDNSMDSKNAFERQDIEELIEHILITGSPNDCTAQFQNDVETWKEEDLTLSKPIFSAEEEKIYNNSLKISNESSAGTKLNTNEDCKDQEIKSPTTTDAGKQDVRDDYSKGQYRSNKESDQLAQEVNMAATSYKVGSLNDLGKNSRVVKRTKGSMPNIPAEKKESGCADSVDKEKRSIVGVGPLMCHLFEKQLFTDVTFYFKETKSCFSAHRVVLGARCDYFEKLLFGKLMNDAVGMEMHVHINDVPLAIFTNIVKYLYTDAVKLVDDCDVLETYRAAKMYRIDPLIKACKTYVDTIELTENNACSMLELGKSKDIYELKTRCISYIQNNTSRVIRSKDFEKCCYSTVRDICMQNVLNLKSEGELLEAVLYWTDLQKTPKQCKEDFRRGLLKRVRFLTFTPREFSEVLQKHPNLLTTKEGLKILMALNNPCTDSLNNLPKWCNKERIRRTVQAGQKSIPKSVVEVSDKRWICITLKPLKKQLQSGPLTCLLHLKCLDVARHITRVTFSLDNVSAKGCTFDISVTVTPEGTSFHMTHSTRSKESVLTFEKPVTVQADQTFEMEVRAESHQHCQFLQFDRWYSDHLDFMGFFISKPMTDRLYFISMIEYEPV